MSNRYVLFPWPFSQVMMKLPGAILVNPEEPKYGECHPDLDSTYMIPVDSLPSFGESCTTMEEGHLMQEAIENNGGEYIFVKFPDAQAHEDDNGRLHDYDGNVFVPIEMDAA